MDQINKQRFFPDSSRSGYFPKGVDMPEDSKDVESTSSSADSRDEEEADHSNDEAAVEKFTGAWGGTGVPDKMEYFRHKPQDVYTVLQMKVDSSSSAGDW